MVGAGLAGAVSARVLKDAGYHVEVSEFARASRQELPATERAGAPFRSSGRWSTRRDRYASGIDPPGAGRSIADTFAASSKNGCTRKKRSMLERLISSQPSQREDGGQGWIRTSEVVRQQIYSLPRLAAPEPTLCFGGDGELGGRAGFGKGKSSIVRPSGESESGRFTRGCARR